MRIFFDIKLTGDSTSPRDLLKLLDSVDELMTGEYNWIVDGVHDHGVIDSPPSLEELCRHQDYLKLRTEEAPTSAHPEWLNQFVQGCEEPPLQDFTTTCEPD